AVRGRPLLCSTEAPYWPRDELWRSAALSVRTAPAARVRTILTVTATTTAKPTETFGRDRRPHRKRYRMATTYGVKPTPTPTTTVPAPPIRERPPPDRTL